MSSIGLNIEKVRMNGFDGEKGTDDDNEKNAFKKIIKVHIIDQLLATTL